MLESKGSHHKGLMRLGDLLVDEVSLVKMLAFLLW